LFACVLLPHYVVNKDEYIISAASQPIIERASRLL